VAILLAGLLRLSFVTKFQMLPYILAIFIGTGSVGIYLAAFVLPELYRRSDPLWSGVGLFYALVLWVEASRLTGGLLLGQALSVLLLGWFVVQALCLRRLAIPPEDRTALPEPLEKLWAANFPEQPSPSAWIEIRQEFPPVSGTADMGVTVRGDRTNAVNPATPSNRIGE
jgi:hypothetical protein